MKVTVLSSSPDHPVHEYINKWVFNNLSNYDVSYIHSVCEIEEGGDILFLISCSEFVHKNVRDLYRYCLVLHASDLPNGRGWSPYVWDILEGKNELVLSLINAEDKIDTGDIWAQKKISLDGSELYDEINSKLFNAETELMSWACENIEDSTSYKQDSSKATYCRKRKPEDSKLDIWTSIASQFNLLRVCDPNRYPSYIEVEGIKYKVILEKIDDE